MAVSVTPRGAGLEFGVPMKLFDTRLASTASASYFDMSRDGQRFYLNMEKEASGRPLTMVLNWTSSLKR